MKEINLSVRSLASFTSRNGSLSSSSYQSVKGIEGTLLHNKIFEMLEKEHGPNINTEYTLRATFTFDDLLINLQGRADAIVFGETPCIIEIKSFNNAKNSFEKHLRSEHLAQLMIYGALFLRENKEIPTIDVTLRYVSITTLESYEKTYSIDFIEAEELLNQYINKYVTFTRKLIDYEYQMLSSVKDFSFPYINRRPGQDDLMKEVLRSLLCKESLLAMAPTGLGKTISTLYPAIKGLQKGKYEKIFYLTAKTQTREVALKAINDMRGAGLFIRSILLKAKESMCPYNKRCDSKGCKYAESYYEKLPQALDEILLIDDITPDIVTKIALKYTICPHELSLDALNYCTIVIGDYNHAFDPRVALVRCFGDDEITNSNALLIDEAHNLVDRARSMYTASISLSEVKKVSNLYKGRNSKAEALLAQIIDYYSKATELISKEESVFSSLEKINSSNIMRTKDFEGTRERIKEFYALIWKTINTLSKDLDDLPLGETREATLAFFFDARFFLTIFENYYNESYITTLNKSDNDLIITLECLDSSSMINQILKDKMPAIFFSATFSPYEYYKNVLLGKDCDYSRYIELPSPFPPENLDIFIDTTISTAYKSRESTSNNLALRIYNELHGRQGNYMVFFPSYEYMEQIQTRLHSLFEKSEADIISQRANMTPIEKQSFLDSFNSKSDSLLIGTCILGGHFGEGIDLVGEKLSGVIVVGVGIPKITPERTILCNFFADKFGDGYAFAYRFPGWEKVLQAVGRVIRTPDDTGFALLIDERLDRNEYISLFPDYWNL